MEPTSAANVEKTEPMDVTTPDVKSTTSSNPTGQAKLSKNFALNEKALFMNLSPEQLQKVLSTFHPSKKSASTDKDTEGFEMVEAESPFVTAAIEQMKMEKSLTENLSPTFSTSGDARVDFFFHVLEQTDPSKTLDLLLASWTTNNLHTLQLIASLRDIKDGKGIRRQYQHCLYWLYKNHPKTLYENLPILLQFGYWKDALQFLMIVCFDGFVHPYFAADDGVKAPVPASRPPARRPRRLILAGSSTRVILPGGKRKAPKKEAKQTDEEKRIYNTKILQHYKHNDDARKISSKEMASLRLKFAREQFSANTKYRAFHIRIAQLFAQQLVTDYNVLNQIIQTKSGEGDSAAVQDADKKNKKASSKLNLSLVGKWTPTLEGHFDRYTLIASTIALEFAKLLQRDEILKKDNIAVAVYLARKFYNKQACIPLRTHLEVPERFMSNNEWSQVNYSRVPAKCMKKNKTYFIKHDEARFEAYLKKDDTKVAGATLKPIEIIKSAMNLNNQSTESERIVTEKQWISLAEDIKKKGGALLSDAIAVCDVSGSMEGDPMIAAIGLTLLTMNMSSPPWNNICITFHEQPSIFELSSKLSLVEKVNSMRAMSWGGSTNLQGVFDQILNIGLKNKLKATEMPNILLIFTDMEFNSAFPGTSDTNFEHAKKEFEKNSFVMPTIVFWNLRDAPGKKSTPVRIDERGTILLSGWSGQLLAFIMSQKDIAACSPWTFVQELIGKEKYNGLKIYD